MANIVKLKFNLDSFFNSLIYLFFGMSIFSIPACSWKKQFLYLTWIFSLAFMLLIFVQLIRKKALKMDLVVFSLILFCIFFTVSTLCNGLIFHDRELFKITPIYLAISTILIYNYCKFQIGSSEKCIFFAFIGLFAFAIYFLIHYLPDIISHDFYRLGKHFGDQNNIAITLGFGFAMSMYYLIYSKKIIFRIFCGISLLLFTFIGITTGSKIFIFLTLAITFFMIIIFFGIKGWWKSTLIILSIIIALVLLIQLPAFETLKKRFDEFFNFILGTETERHSTGFRFLMFEDGMNLFFSKFLFGWGINGYASMSGLNYGWSHNNFSELLANYGLLGFLTYHFGFIIGFYNIFRGKRVINKKLCLLVFIFFIVTMFSVSLDVQKIYAYLIGIFFAMSNPIEGEVYENK